MTIPSFVRAQPDGVLLSVKLQPRASANEICQPVGGELRVRVTAPPVDGAANEALVQVLAARLDCPANRVGLIRGRSSRHKLVKVYGMEAQEVLAKLTKVARV